MAEPLSRGPARSTTPLEVWRAVYDSVGGVVSAPAVFDCFVTLNQNVDITSTPGGFAIVYEDNSWTETNDITMARFDSAGTFQGFSNISNPT